MPMYNLIEYSDNYAKALGSVWQYCRDEPDDNNITKPESKLKFTNNICNVSIAKQIK